jgi:hypothetical protein
MRFAASICAGSLKGGSPEYGHTPGVFFVGLEAPTLLGPRSENKREEKNKMCLLGGFSANFRRLGSGALGAKLHAEEVYSGAWTMNAVTKDNSFALYIHGCIVSHTIHVTIVATQRC